MRGWLGGELGYGLLTFIIRKHLYTVKLVYTALRKSEEQFVLNQSVCHLLVFLR